MIENHLKCKYCNETFPKGLYQIMYDHMERYHTEKAKEMILSQFVEVAYVPPSKRTKDELNRNVEWREFY